MTVTVPVLDECRRRRGGEPCIKTYKADMVTVHSTHECVEWCPVLQKRLEVVIEPAREAAE